MGLTPEQFNKLVTRDEFERGLEDVKEEIRGEINRVLEAVDGIARKFDNHDTEHVSNIAAHDRFDERITEMEKQIEVKAAVA